MIYNSIYKLLVFFGSTIALTAAAIVAPAEAAPAITLSARLTLDSEDVVQSPSATGARLLTNLDVVADIDLDQLLSWHGARAKVDVLNNLGGRPNDLAGTLQGVDNIEVGNRRTKLYQAWIEQDLLAGKAALLLGLADLNADFYQNDSAGVLLAPAFGIGSELAATGTNGPSIFPSTALTARLRVALGAEGYAKVAIVDARSGVLGDPGGIDWRMGEGALLVGEAGWTGHGKLAVGYWRYTKRQNDIRQVRPDGSPKRRIANGAYLLIDQPVTRADAPGPVINLFARVGISDGTTTPFQGGWQVGVLVGKLFPGRPDGQLSIGLDRGALSDRYRSNAADAGLDLSAGETGFEVTYSDQATPFLRIQPDLQYIVRPGGARATRSTVVVGLRLVLTAAKAISDRRR